jgi:hypothetical protein
MDEDPLPLQRPFRRLQQENGVTIVEHPADFISALSLGNEHIEFRAHLDHTPFAQVEAERVWAPVVFPASVKTLKVRFHGDFRPLCNSSCCVPDAV